ncbi:MAG: transposase [Verrucomicrobiales bacterium]
MLARRPIYEAIKSTIIQAVFLHCDETGLSISGKLHWLHTASTPELVYLHIDKHRGEAALRMGILEGFEGWVVHDFSLRIIVSTGSSTSCATAHCCVISSVCTKTMDNRGLQT